MRYLSDRAQKLVEDFRRSLESLTVEEREWVLQRVTADISAMNEDVKGLYNSLQAARDKRNEERARNGLDDLSDYI